MQLKESAENYLEIILMLKKENGMVRAIDIANDLGYSKPSVSVAMKKLRESGYISVDKNGNITLEAAGFEIASKILDRHQTISNLLMTFGVRQEVAEKDACKIEHVISEESYECLKEFLVKNQITSL